MPSANPNVKTFDDLNFSINTMGWIVKRSGLDDLVLEKHETTPIPSIIIGCRVKDVDIREDADQIRTHQIEHGKDVVSDLKKVTINDFKGYCWTDENAAVLTTWYKLRDPASTKNWMISMYIMTKASNPEQHMNEIKRIYESITLLDR